jgi:hypothetical protein
MSYSINWTTRGELTFNQNIEYLQRDGNNTVINQFLDIVAAALEKISANPFFMPFA